ncbi:uncharacterized protein LOC131691255 [Topomyia yanbarensis]|uniref:uncharacterized protein LOC131691255 n=1 Tax=Topomyia yanbarensis TaxID=2498891 RepID=UPI00273C7136|nr:uncharacterized protein LOC131691255 [Topomyia yanbarensis]
MGRISRLDFQRSLRPLVIPIVLALLAGKVSAEEVTCQKGGICVPSYLCENGTVNTSGTGLIDIRIGDDSICPEPLVCCYSLDSANSVEPDDTQCEGKCVVPEQCLDAFGGLGVINLRFMSSMCPENQVCCKNLVVVCDGFCISPEQCVDDEGGINLRISGKGCPDNQICCSSTKSPQLTSSICKGSCVNPRQCSSAVFAEGLINLRFSDGCSDNQVCCPSVIKNECDGVCTTSDQCEDNANGFNLRFADEYCPSNQICCTKLKSLQGLPNEKPPECNGKCVLPSQCQPGNIAQDLINLRFSDSGCPFNQVCCQSPEKTIFCDGVCVPYQLCVQLQSQTQHKTIDLRFSDQSCPANQVCCQNIETAPKYSCDGNCVPLGRCPKLRMTSLIDLRFSSTECPSNQVCCKKSQSVPLCSGVCIAPEECADTVTITNYISYMIGDDSCPVNTMCCKKPKQNNHRFLSVTSTDMIIPDSVSCTCVPIQQCPDVTTGQNLINLRITKSKCPINQICCKNPAKSTCEGTCTAFEQCQEPIVGINLRTHDLSCPENQICCKQTRTPILAAEHNAISTCNGTCVLIQQCPEISLSKEIINLRFNEERCPVGQVCCSNPNIPGYCDGSCVPNSECIDQPFIDVIHSGCPVNQICCRHIKPLPVGMGIPSSCKGSCVPVQSCPYFDRSKNLINLRLTIDGCPSNQICCQTAFQPNVCDGMCTSYKNCDDNVTGSLLIDLRDSEGICPSSQICCKKLKQFKIEPSAVDVTQKLPKCEGRCVPFQQCPEYTLDKNTVNLRNAAENCPPNEIC